MAAAALVDTANLQRWQRRLVVEGWRSYTGEVGGASTVVGVDSSSSSQGIVYKDCTHERAPCTRGMRSQIAGPRLN